MTGNVIKLRHPPLIRSHCWRYTMFIHVSHSCLAWLQWLTLSVYACLWNEICWQRWSAVSLYRSSSALYAVRCIAIALVLQILLTKTLRENELSVGETVLCLHLSLHLPSRALHSQWYPQTRRLHLPCSASPWPSNHVTSGQQEEHPGREMGAVTTYRYLKTCRSGEVKLVNRAVKLTR